MLCEHCHKIVSQHDADSTNDVLNGCNLISKFEQVDTLIAHLNLKRSNLNREINRHYSPFVKKIPEDVLAIVFSLSLPDDTEFRTSLKKFDLSAPLIFGAVCRDWRQIAFSNPTLWSAMAINISSSQAIFESQTSVAREWLARSGQRPLSIRIVWKSNSYPVSLLFATVIKNESSRWHTFHLSIPHQFYHFFGGSTLSAPILESLQFHSNELQQAELNPKLFVLRDCPSLREIRMTNVYAYLIIVPMDSVTRIYGNGIPFMESRKILRRTPSLVHCELMDVPRSARDRNNLLSTNLKHLTVKIVTNDPYFFFADLAAPCLESLRFETNEDCNTLHRIADPLRQFLIRSGCSLETFELVDAQFSLDSMLSLLEVMPTLKNLTVSTPEKGGKVILEVLARVIASQGQLIRQGFLPMLETLTFDGHSFRSNKVPYISPIDPSIPYYTSQRSLCSVTFTFHGDVENLPEEAITFLLALKDYGITLKVCTGDGDDLLQPSIDFYKAAPQWTDWSEEEELGLTGFEA
jgi:hypothetical protein